METRAHYYRQHYLEFLYPIDTWTYPTGVGDPIEVQGPNVNDVDVPADAYGFRFFEIVFATIDIDESQIELQSQRLDESPVYYCGGHIYTLEELKHEFTDRPDIIDEAQREDWDKIILTRKNVFRLFGKSDRLLESCGAKVAASVMRNMEVVHTGEGLSFKARMIGEDDRTVMVSYANQTEGKEQITRIQSDSSIDYFEFSVDGTVTVCWLTSGEMEVFETLTGERITGEALQSIVQEQRFYR